MTAIILQFPQRHRDNKENLLTAATKLLCEPLDLVVLDRWLERVDALPG